METLSLLLPKGRLQEKVLELLKSTGLSFSFGGRSYRPVSSDPEISAKILKPQNIASLVALGRHDIGFVGHDWIRELGLDGPESDLVEVLDLGFNPVRIVAAAPDHLVKNGQLNITSRIVVASEYEVLAREYLEQKGLDAKLVKTFGATEALPPEDADLIIDNTSTGATLASNRLVIIDELLRSTTRLVAHRGIMEDPAKRAKLDRMLMLIKSVLAARSRVMVEMNVDTSGLEALLAELPAMKAPTICPLSHDEGYAVKVVAPSADVPTLLPNLKAAGARDILVYKLEQILP
jgi:ATP phosphoribosyltransferase